MNNTNNQNLMLSELLQVCTPAPWAMTREYTGRKEQGGVREETDRIFEKEKEINTIANVSPYGKECLANAKLITLAPTIAAELIKERDLNAKLLEACKHYLSAGVQQSTDFLTQREAYFLAKAAIKQAEEL
jgi:hypothetical protein